MTVHSFARSKLPRQNMVNHVRKPRQKIDSTIVCSNEEIQNGFWRQNKAECICSELRLFQYIITR